MGVDVREDKLPLAHVDRRQSHLSESFLVQNLFDLDGSDFA